MQLNVQRLDLIPQVLDHTADARQSATQPQSAASRGEFVRRHVVAAQPELFRAREAVIARALVRKLDVLLVQRLQLRSDRITPERTRKELDSNLRKLKHSYHDFQA